MLERLPVPLLDDLAPNGFSYGGLYVVEFDSDSLWYETSLTIAASALRQGTKVEYHIFQHFPDDAAEALSHLGIDVAKFKGEGLLRIIDSYTQTMEYEDEQKEPSESFRIAKTRTRPLDLVRSAENWAREAKTGYPDEEKRWLHIDDNTGIFLRYNDEKTMIDKWRTAIIPYSVRARETPHILAFARGVASTEFYSQFEIPCDGVVDLTTREEVGQVENYIRVRTLRGRTFDSRWHRLELTGTGEVKLREKQSQAGQRRLAAIMFTDVVGYTSIAQKNEALALELLEEHRNRLRPLFWRHNGREVKTMGDAFLVEFPSALEAAACAFEIQQMMQGANKALPAERKIAIRIGLHLGDVMEHQGDVSGDAVNVASRIEAFAEAGGVCLTRQVYDHIYNKLDLPFANLGPKTLKNVAQPMEVYRMLMPWEAESAAPRSQPDTRRIAVLPFSNMSPDPNDEYFADGMTEELISTMSKIEQVEVISRTSVMQFKKNPKPILEVSKDLSVGTVLEGSVRKAGEKLRVTVQMIDATRDRHIWSESFDRDLKDVFAIQSDIARLVADALRVKILPKDGAKLEKKPTHDTGAYLLYLKGRYYYNERSRESLEKAVEYFTEATKKDPEYAKAYAGLAECYMILENWGYITPSDATPKRRFFAEKSMELDESLAESHVALAVTLGSKDLDFKGAEREFRRAIELNPSLASAHHLLGNGLLYAQGRMDESIRELREAKMLDPMSPMIAANLGDNLMAADRFEEAEAEFRSLLETNPSVASYARSRLGLLFVKQSRFEEGISEIQKSMELRPIDGRMDLLYAYLQSGQKEGAEKVMGELESMTKERYVSNVQSALINAAAGRKEMAFEFLQKAFEERSNQLWVNLREPQFDIIRPDSRFQRLLMAIGAVDASAT